MVQDWINSLFPLCIMLCVVVSSGSLLQMRDKKSCWYSPSPFTIAPNNVRVSTLWLAKCVCSELLGYWLSEFREELVSINWPAPCWLHHMERSGCNSWDRPGHSARELERRAAGDILICAAMCKGMHLQPGSVPVIRPASVFLEEGRSRKTWGNKTTQEMLSII